MASLQEPGKIRVFVRRPRTGRTVELIASTPVQDLAPAGGAPDGALASVTTNERWLKYPVQFGVPIQTDDVVYVEFTADGADGLDVSDCVWSFPFVKADGGVMRITRSDFANPAPADYTAVAAIPVLVGGYRVAEGLVFFGGKPGNDGVYCDMQDDTA